MKQKSRSYSLPCVRAYASGFCTHKYDSYAPDIATALSWVRKYLCGTWVKAKKIVIFLKKGIQVATLPEL